MNKQLIEDENLNMIEIELFDAAFTRLRGEFNSVKYMGPVSDLLADYLKENNFQSFKRARMSINREAIESLVDPKKLPQGFKIRDYELGDKQILAEVMALSHFNKSHPDGLIWTNWNGVEGCMDLLQGIENSTYGKFNRIHNKVVEKDSKPIAVSFVTTIGNNAGYIPEIVVSQSEKNKGLGKLLLTYSLKEFIKRNPNSSNIDLDVTIDNNNASKLYTSLGFGVTNNYVVYVWNAN